MIRMSFVRPMAMAALLLGAAGATQTSPGADRAAAQGRLSSRGLLHQAHALSRIGRADQAIQVLREYLAQADLSDPSVQLSRRMFRLLEGYAAFEALSEADKARLSALRAVHDQAYSRSRSGDPRQMTEDQNKASPPVVHPVVRTHPETDRKCIFLGEHASHIAGLPLAEGRQKVHEINEMATRPAFVHRHHWQPGQLVMWDNRCLLHRATEFDAWNERRIIRRVTVLGDAS